MEVHDRPDCEAWSRHLNSCTQCAGNPFSLCPVGNRLLVDAASAVVMTLRGVSGQVKTADGHVADEAADPGVR